MTVRRLFEWLTDRLSLRLALPLVLGIFAVFFIIFAYFIEMSRGYRIIEENNTRNITTLMGHLQSLVEHLLSESQTLIVQKQIAQLAVDTNILLILVVDDRDQIRAANRRELIGHELTVRNLDAIQSYLSPQDREQLGSDIKLARKTMRGLTALNREGTLILSYYPITLSPDTGKLRQFRAGLIFMLYDLRHLKEEARTEILDRTGMYVLTYILASLLLGLLLHFLVSRRVAGLLADMKSFSRGERKIPGKKRYPDEISQIFNGLGEMMSGIISRENELTSLNEDLRREIENHKKVRTELRQANEILEKIFASSAFLIAYMDRDFNFIRVNPKYAEADDRSPEFFPGKNHFALYPNEENREVFSQVVESGISWIEYSRPFEYAEHPERGISYWDWNLTPVKSPSGRVEGLILFLVNVTEKVNAEKHQRETQRLLQKMAENYPHSYISIIEKDLTIGYTAGQEFQRQNLDPNQFVGLPLEPVFGELTPTVKKNYLRTFQGLETTFELSINNQHQRYRTIPLFEESGEINQIMAVVENITDQKNAEMNIRRSLAEKEILLREIHHRVKNNMALISALLDLQALAIDDDVCSGVFKDTRDRIKTLAEAHEGIYEAEDLLHVNFARYVQSIVRHLFISHNTDQTCILSSFDIEELSLDIDTLIPIGLIINEIVSNSLKHAFAPLQKGKIEIKAYQDAGRLRLSISDDGRGHGGKINLDNTTTLGLRIIKILLAQLEGDISLRPEPGTGFYLTFPLSCKGS